MTSVLPYECNSVYHRGEQITGRMREKGWDARIKVQRAGCGTCPKHISQSAWFFSYSLLWQQPPLQLDSWLAVDPNEHCALQTSDKSMLYAHMHLFIQPLLHSRLLVGCWFQGGLHPFFYSFIYPKESASHMDWAKVPLIVKWALLGTNKQKHYFTITQAIFWQFLTQWHGQKTFGLWMDSHMLTLCECERDRFCLCNPGWLGTRSVDQAVIERTEICLLELKLRASLLSFVLFFFFLSEIGRPGRAIVGLWEGRGVRMGKRVFFGLRSDRYLGEAFRSSCSLYDFF